MTFTFSYQLYIHHAGIDNEGIMVGEPLHKNLVLFSIFPNFFPILFRPPIQLNKFALQLQKFAITIDSICFRHD